mgnify:CR=1 FL=1
MQKFMMFEDIPETSQIMYPNGAIKTKDEVKTDYPILATKFGVIGITTDDEGTVGELIMMGYYDDVNRFVDTYKSQGAEVTSDMTYAEKCEAITEFVNNPVDEAEDALDSYLAM